MFSGIKESILSTRRSDGDILSENKTLKSANQSLEERLDDKCFSLRRAIERKYDSDMRCEDLTKKVTVLKDSLASKIMVEQIAQQKRPDNEEEKKSRGDEFDTQLN